MSEYQYYEWQTIDRPLTDKERAAVNRLSSHIEVSPIGAWVEYSWGDFKHDAKQVLAQYFDAFLYMANWGSRELMFRFPKALIDPKQIEPYCLEYCVALEPIGDYFVLTISLGEEEPTGEWIEGGDWLAALAPLRNDILLGDTRALYLAWLANVGSAELVDELEPPLPAGLGKLTTPLNRLARFLEIDPHLLKAAAAASDDPSSTPDAALRAAVGRLTRSECDDFLWRLAQGEPRLTLTFQHRLQDLIGAPTPQDRPRRTLDELVRARDRLVKAEQRRKQQAAEARHKQEMEALAGRETATWTVVERLLESYQPKAYDSAVALLTQLRDLAVYQGTQAAFQLRIDHVSAKYARRSGLISRLRSAGLVTLHMG